MESYLEWMLDEFEPSHDHFRLIGEDNLRRYLAVPNVRVRVAADDTPWSIVARAAAARAAGCRVVVSEPPSLPAAQRDAVELLDALTDSWAGAIEFITETDDELAAALRAGARRPPPLRQSLARPRRHPHSGDGVVRLRRPTRQSLPTAASSSSGISRSKASRTSTTATATSGEGQKSRGAKLPSE